MGQANNTGKIKVLFIVNPISGIRGRSQEEFSATVSDYLDADKYEADFKISTYPGHAVTIGNSSLFE